MRNISVIISREPIRAVKCRKGLAPRQRLPKQRERVAYGGGSQIIDYSYANYDMEAVKADYEKAAEELSQAQTALDLVNTTAQLEIVL